MNAPNPENVCPICNKVFSRKADCNRHLRLHAGIRPYPCEVPGCNKRFAQYTALKTHRNVHTGLKPFRCEFTGCKATFGDPSSCARHRREIHNPGKPFKCPIPGCSSSIRRSSSFRTHLKKHGKDPSAYRAEFSQRDRSPAEAWQEIERITAGQVSVHSGSSCNQELPLSGPLEPWDPDQFLSLPVVPPVPMVMQPALTSIVSSSSPLLFAPSPRIASDNGNYFLSPSGGSPESSSPYSSPMSLTPILTPETGPGFITDFDVQLSSCLAAQDWTRNAWQDPGIQFV